MEHHAILSLATKLEDSTVPEAFWVPGVDVVHVSVSQFGIDEARALTTQASQTAMGTQGRTFVIVTQSLTAQAQNALLKLFEEPPRACQFYLVIPSESLLLPTLRSRLFLSDSLKNSNVTKDVEAFFTSDYKGRLEQIAAKVKEKDQLWIDSVVETALKTSSGKASLTASVLAASHYRGSGAAKKMLLEEIALSLPSQVTV